MADFDEEAKRILKLELERAARDFRKIGVADGVKLGVLLILVFGWEPIRSIFNGSPFPWSDVKIGIAIFGGLFVALEFFIDVDAFLSEKRDARLIRIELKLDRLLECSEEMPESLKKQISDQCESMRGKVRESA